MTAKGRLIEEMRKKGQTYKPKGSGASSVHESDYGGKRQPFKHPAPIGQKRSGESATAGCLTYQQTTSASIAVVTHLRGHSAVVVRRKGWLTACCVGVCRRNWSIQASGQEERSCSRR